MSHARTQSEPPRLLQRWAGFDARLPWVGDILVAAVVVWLSLQYYVTEPLYRRTVLVYIAVCLAAMLFRRKAPATMLVLVMTVGIAVRLADTGLMRDPEEFRAQPEGSLPVPSVEASAAVVLIYTVAARLPRPKSFPLLSAAIVWWAAATLVFSAREGLAQEALFVIAFAGMSALLGTNVRTNRLRVADLQRRAEQLALERDQREQLAASQERARIAREMHDVVAHSLSVMISLSDGALSALDRDPELARRAIEEATKTGRSALADTRRLLGVLRDDARPTVSGVPDVDGEREAELAPQPTEVSLETLIGQFQGTGLPVTFAETGPPLPDDAGLRLAVYRIVQEALTNVLRYASASTAIGVRVDRSHRDVTILVENEAAPSSTVSMGSGKGLIGMRERAAVYDGTIEAGPTPTGWRVRATMTWKKG